MHKNDSRQVLSGMFQTYNSSHGELGGIPGFLDPDHNI